MHRVRTDMDLILYYIMYYTIVHPSPHPVAVIIIVDKPPLQSLINVLKARLVDIANAWHI